MYAQYVCIRSLNLNQASNHEVKNTKGMDNTLEYRRHDNENTAEYRLMLFMIRVDYFTPISGDVFKTLSSIFDN